MRVFAPLHLLVLAIFLPCTQTAQRFAGPPQPTASQTTTQNGRGPAPSTATDPVANPKAIVQSGHARFTVLTPELLRLEWSPNKTFEDHPSFIILNRNLPVPSFTVERQGNTPMDGYTGTVTLDTGKLKLTYNGSKDETGFTAANLAIALTVNGHPVTWHPGDAPTGNLGGTTRTLDGANGGKDLKEPIGPGLISRDGWSVIDDNGPLFDGTNFAFNQGPDSPQPWVLQRPSGNQDLYFFGYGHHYRQALTDYVQVAGRIPLPPRFAFGAWWSRYWAYSDQELRDLVTGFHQNSVPYDVFVIDMDWHDTRGRHFEQDDASGHRLGWSGYSWDKNLFPDPTDFLAELHSEGLKITLNLHPASGVQPWETAYPQFARNMGVDPATRQYVPFDLTDKKFATNYMNLLHHPLEAQGVDFWWLDWQQENNSKTAGVNPTWWLNYVHFTDQEKEGKRPLLFHRWGGLGNHRYQIGFSGDTISVWDSLAFQPDFTAQAANVGYAYWSHDIGGHMPGPIDPELFTRWIQFGIYSPILRTHTTKNAAAERRIWAYPEPYSDVMRSSFQQRYAMEPYIYTEARRTYDTGIAFLHPLYYDSPEAPEAYTFKNEYTFGQSMLVAPIVAPADPATGLSSETVWLPQGDWLERDSGKAFHGPLTARRSYGIDQVPVFLKAGSIVPGQPPMEYTGQKPVDPLTLTVYPLADCQTSTYTLYEDNGHAEDYKQNAGTAWTDVTATQVGDLTTITVAPVRTGAPAIAHSSAKTKNAAANTASTRAYELRLPADWPPSEVVANGQHLAFTLLPNKPGWHFEGNTLTTVIPVVTHSVHTPTVITVRRAPGSIASRPQLDNFAGTMHGARAAYDQISNDFPSTNAVPEALTVLMQTGNRIGYHPETAGAELAALPAQLNAAIAATAALQGKAAMERKPGTHEMIPAPPARAADHEARVANALANLNRTP